MADGRITGTLAQRIGFSVAAELQPAPRGLDARQLGRVFGTIDENISERITVSMLSSVAGLSRSYFSHAFRVSVGRTPHEHVVRLRIDHAMKLMLEGDKPLSEIALAAGFADQAHFSKAFRRIAGITPGQWRRLHQAVGTRHDEHGWTSERTAGQALAGGVR